MSLVDTCGWIEYLANGKLKPSFTNYLAKESELVIPTIIQFELYKWICRERDESLALNVIGVTERGTVVSLDTNLALMAADCAQQYHLAMADSIIYACAQLYEVELITCDEHFKTLPNVIYFQKN